MTPTTDVLLTNSQVTGYFSTAVASSVTLSRDQLGGVHNV